VASHAVHTGWNMSGGFAGGRTAVVATRAIGSTIEGVVVRLGAQPGAGGLVAVLAHRLAVVNGGCRARSGAKAGVDMAGCTLRRYRYIGMELTWIPSAVAPFVATVAVGDGHTTQRFIGNVIGRQSAGRRKAAGVAGGTLVRHRHLRVVPFGGLPSVGVVTGHAVGAGGNVGCHLASCATSVMAAGAVGSAAEATVVRLGAAQPTTRGFVAVLAHGHAIVDSGCRACRQAETAIQVTRSTLVGHLHIGVEGPRIPAGETTLVATVAVGNGHATQ